MINYSIFEPNCVVGSSEVFFSDLKLRTYLKFSNKMGVFLSEVKLSQDFKESYSRSLNQSTVWITFEDSLSAEEDVFLNICLFFNAFMNSTGLENYPTHSDLSSNIRLRAHLTSEFDRLSRKIKQVELFEDSLINSSSKIYFFFEYSLRLP